MAADEAVEEKSKRRRKRRSDEMEDAAESTENRGITERKGRATPGKRTQSASESTNIATRSVGGIRGYLAGVRDEMDKVIWPTKDELFRLTRIVLAVMIASAVVLGIISFIFTEVFVLGIAEDNPIVFVVLFAGAGVGYFLLKRVLETEHDPY